MKKINDKEICLQIDYKNDYDFVDEFNETRIWLNKQFAREITQELKNEKKINPNGRIMFRFARFEKGSILAVFTTIIVGIAINVASQIIYDYIRRRLDEKRRQKDR